MRTALPLLLLTLSACDAALIPARHTGDVYEFRTSTNPPLVLRWPSGSTVGIHVAGGGAARAPVLEAALDHAIAEWNRHALFGEYRLARSELAGADVVLRWTDDPSPVDLSGCPPATVRAVTTFCAADPGNLGRGLAVFPHTDGGGGRVKMVVSVLPSEAAIPGRVRALVTHEVGHVLGLMRHSSEPRDLMYSEELTTAVASRRDIASIQLLYQARPQVVP